MKKMVGFVRRRIGYFSIALFDTAFFGGEASRCATNQKDDCLSSYLKLLTECSPIIGFLID
jgi:hypothetical protein